VATFGFRGEALASIGAVARVRLASRLRGATDGAEVVMDAGRLGPAKPAGVPEGTTVEVRDLFHAVPARRKFLRSIEVELEHVDEAVTRAAMAHPGVRFELVVDGERRRLLAPAKDRRERIAAFFGQEIADALVEVNVKTPAAAFEALAAPPKYARLSLKWQFVYLNGRFIRDRVLTRAINEAYHETLPHGRYPMVFLFLNVPAGEVDVNVHPTKIEVRFRQVWKIHDLLLGALRQRMLSSELAPSIDVARHADVPPAPPPRATHQEIVEFFTGVKAAEPAALVQQAPLVTTGRRVFQLHDRYLVEEVEEGIRIIDQHALHERVMLESLRKQYATTDVPKQRLLLPASVDVTEREHVVLDEHKALLESMGFLIEDFGPNSVAVRAVPALVADADPGKLVRDFLEVAREHSETEQSHGHAVPLIDRALEFLACRAAIKFGERLAPEEIEKLLKDAAELDFSSTCAHGRPTAIRLTMDDLERFFKRRG
jgi:DNA mismatch repair protein MutL